MAAKFQASIQEEAACMLEEAILIYRGTQTHCTVNRIKMVDGSPVVMAGKVMSPKAIREFTQEILGKNTGPQFLPENCLAFSDDKIVWWVPASNREIYLDDLQNHEKGSYRVAHPPLLMSLGDKNLSVFALKENKRPDLNSTIYFAPYPNINIHGAVCVGTAKTPRHKDLSHIEKWTDWFFDSKFSHSNYGGNKATKVKGGIKALWSQVIEKGEFPNDSLIATELKLKEIIDA